MAHQLTGKTIASTYEQLIYRTTTVPSTGTTTTQLMTSEADQTDDIGLPLYISTQRVGIGTATPRSQFDIGGASTPKLSFSSTEGNIIADETFATIEFAGKDADTFAVGAQILARGDAAWGDLSSDDDDAPTRLEFYTQSDGGTDALTAPRMTIDSTGYVGIGVADPDKLLEINGTTDTSVTNPSLAIKIKGTTDTINHTSGIVFANPNIENAAAITCIMKEVTNGGTDLAFVTRTSAGTTSEAMRIDEDGKVGIGIAAPSAPLEVFKEQGHDDKDTIIQLDSGTATGTSGLSIDWNEATAGVYASILAHTASADDEKGVLEFIVSTKAAGSQTAVDMYAGTNAAKMVITEDGQVGIGIISPSSTLHVAATGRGDIQLSRIDADVVGDNTDYAAIYFSVTGDATSPRYGSKIVARTAEEWSDGGTDAGTDLEFYVVDNGTSTLDLRLTIKDDGDFVGSSSASISDERLKQDITSLTGSLDKINQLNGISFTWKPEAHKNTNKVYLGLIAQEVEGIFPDVVRDESVHDVQAKDAVEAKDAVLDEKGNVIEEAIEAQDAIKGESYKSLEYTALIAPIIQAIQELSAKVEALENA